jgi:NAD(P)-dependent dehydrogenase (short-subunit alcohol dehydrogenase family)
VFFGDVNDKAGKELESELGSSVIYQHCDTSQYRDQLALFAATEKAFGRIDIVVANAGVGTHKDPFLADTDWREEPPMVEIDINLKGCIFTTRIGQAYLRKYGGGDIVLTSSIAGFKESPGIVIYTASKHGVIGLMRSLHRDAHRENINVNVVCPWYTKTGMVKGIEVGWNKLHLPENMPEDVARALVMCATANRGEAKQTHDGAVSPFEGKIVWVGGGESYEIEDNIQRLEPEWLGEENSRVLQKGQDYLSAGDTSWDEVKKT